MNKIIKIFIPLLLVLILQDNSFSQNNYRIISKTDTLLIDYNNIYNIKSISIIPLSESIIIKSKLLNKNEYSFNYSTATFKLKDSSKYSTYDTLIINYKLFRLSLNKIYKRRSLVTKLSKNKIDSVLVVKQEQNYFSNESIFGNNIQKSGSIVRGFTVGTTKDFSLNSGLRLQLSGNLSTNIELVAALTDNNSPIQPEGNTERLDELDKVFIQIKHPNAEGTFGDFIITKRVGEFGVVNRKLQGIKGEFHFNSTNQYVSFASSKGKFNTNIFNGQDGVQGPYRLTGKNNQNNIIVIAGTEKVYIDGIKMKRGEYNDYFIDYGNARITFTPNKLITVNSRIIVDFEYTDRRYKRNFFIAGGNSKILNNKIELQYQFIREGDNKSAPIDILLSESDKNILANAGDDINKASKNGVSLAIKDSNGVRNGRYERIDSTINGSSFIFYRYNPGTINAIYNVAFSVVGSGKGDYVRESLGIFRFVGIKQGSYKPIIFLPLPQINNIGNIKINYKPKDGIELSIELAGSNFDKNRFSNLDNNDNFGSASIINLKIKPQNVSIGSVNFGRIGLTYKDRFINKKYNPIDRINVIEFNRDYNINNVTNNTGQNLRELNLNFLPNKNLNISSFYGYLKQGGFFTSNRFKNTINYNYKNKLNIYYNIDYVKTDNTNFNTKWTKQDGTSIFKRKSYSIGLNYLAENKRNYNINSDSLLAGSLKYYEFAPFIRFNKINGLKLSFKYLIRKDYASLNGNMLEQANSTSQFYDFEYFGKRTINSRLTITLRDKNFTNDFSTLNFKDSKTVLIRSRTGLRLLQNAVTGNVYYEVSTQKSARLQELFVKVAKGKGNFIFLGDLNKNGIKDRNEFEPALFDGDYIKITTPTDELFPVINLKTSTTWHIFFKDIFSKNSIIGKILSPVSTETFLRVEESSREKDIKQIYLLHFSHFQDLVNTIRGTNFIQQDFFINENSYEFSLRFRYLQSKSLNQFVEGPTRSYTRERSIRLRMNLVPEINNQTEFKNAVDNSFLISNLQSTRRRLITTNSISSDFAYRPEDNIEVGFTFKAGKSTDEFPAVPTVIDFNSQAIRTVYSFSGKGRLKIEIKRDELLGNTAGNPIPFEITQSKLLGKNYFWNLNFEYKMASNLQTSLSYSGRLRTGEKAVHTARAEFRAYF